MQPVSASTHTVEMDQIADLNRRLRAYRPATLSAADLGLAGAVTAPAPPGLLAGEAVLVALHWDGPPEYPYIHGSFGRGAESRTVMLHTAALRELSHRLHARHEWGVGSPG